MEKTLADLIGADFSKAEHLERAISYAENLAKVFNKAYEALEINE